MTTIGYVIKAMNTIKKAATENGMASTAADIDDSIKELKAAKDKIDSTAQTEEQLCDQMRQMTDDVCDSINSMSSEDIARDNNDYNFKRYPTLHAAADSCVGNIEAYGKDSRDLSIAFSGEFIHRQRDPDDISKNVKCVIDVHHDRILSAMSWMEYLAEKKSPKWVKSNCIIPKKAMASRDAFEKFVKKFSKKHGIFYPE